jgi:hypothetical protein
MRGRLAIGAGAALLCLAFFSGTFAQDQKPGPAGDQKPGTFVSPINGKNERPNEAGRFAKLVKLFETREAARCDPKRKGYFGAWIAYRDAEFEYVRDFSPHYDPNVPEYPDDENNAGPSEEDMATAADARKLEEAVKRAAKPQKCPNGPGSAQYTSPFGENKPLGCDEARDFVALVALDKKRKKAADAVEEVETLPDDDKDVVARKKSYDEANAAYEKAVGQFIRDWSNNVYMGDPQKNEQSAKTWQDDKNKVEAFLDMLWDKEPAVGSCPKTATPPADKKKPKHRRLKKHGRTEDDPLYMENYSSPGGRNAGAHGNGGDAGMPEAPPPAGDEDRVAPTDRNLPGPPSSIGPQ